MKIATWNVNGIRARHGQLLEWIEHERPDVICLQEIKATIDQLPMGLCDLEGYWCYWHGGKGYSGVGLHVSKERWPEGPAFAHPAFDFENRIVTADSSAISRWRRSTCRTAARTFPPRCASSSRCASSPRSTGRRPPARHVRRPERGAHRDGRAPEGAQAQRDRPAAGGARAARAIIGEGLVDVGRALAPDDDGLFTWWAPWRNMRQRNIGWRLDYVLASQRARRHRHRLPRASARSAPAITRPSWHRSRSTVDRCRAAVGGRRAALVAVRRATVNGQR